MVGGVAGPTAWTRERAQEKAELASRALEMRKSQQVDALVQRAREKRSADQGLLSAAQPK